MRVIVNTTVISNFASIGQLDVLRQLYGVLAMSTEVYDEIQAGLAEGYRFSLLLDSRVLRDQELNERRQQCFASLADIVHELKEAQVGWEFLLGNTPMRA